MKLRDVRTTAILLILTMFFVPTMAETLELSADLQTIEAESFLNCASLTGTLAIPDGVTSIGASAFEGCTGFTGLPLIPASVKVIGPRAFAGCENLSGVMYLMPDIDVADTAFEGCPNLTVLRTAPRMRIALIAESSIDGDDMITDCYNGAKRFCSESGYPLRLFNVGDGTVDEAIEAAIEANCNILLMPGFMMTDAMLNSAARHGDVKYIGIDIESEGELPDNVYTVTYREEQAGFLAGYAAVRLGFRHLGFLGGMSIPSVNRYGYGFVQGADAAATELNVTDAVTVEFSYANSFSPTGEIEESMEQWFSNLGVEVVFACGGGIWGSVGGAIAQTEKGKIIGVDTDQAGTIDGIFGEGTTLTSAMKNTGATVYSVLDNYDANAWPMMSGSQDNLGIVSADPDENHVGLAPSTRFGAGFTRSDYEALVARLYDGAYAVSASLPETAITVRGLR